MASSRRLADQPKLTALIALRYQRSGNDEGDVMSVVTVRNLPGETHRALKLRAARNGRSTEAEIRHILEEAVRPAERVQLGPELAPFGRRFGGLALEVDRDTAP